VSLSFRGGLKLLRQCCECLCPGVFAHNSVGRRCSVPRPLTRPAPRRACTCLQPHQPVVRVC
jgi:hypothetical protein